MALAAISAGQQKAPPAFRPATVCWELHGFSCPGSLL